MPFRTPDTVRTVAPNPGHAEVSQLHRTVVPKKNIVGGNVPMNDAAFFHPWDRDFVGVRHGTSDAKRDAQSDVHRNELMPCERGL